MPTARVFQSGNSQAVRLPKAFRFKTDEVEILRRGDEVILRERPKTMKAFVDALMALPQLPDDFYEPLPDDPLPEPLDLSAWNENPQVTPAPRRPRKRSVKRAPVSR